LSKILITCSLMIVFILKGWFGGLVAPNFNLFVFYCYFSSGRVFSSYHLVTFFLAKKQGIK
ncbi:hypothetical protein QNI19_19980, partial [Cytophagaceae bacterium DM2B3-1]